MSRIGKAVIKVPQGVEVKIDGNNVTVKGKLGELQQSVGGGVEAKLNEGVISLTRSNDEKEVKAKHGLYRALIANMVEGVSNGYTINQELVGVGYKAEVKGQLLELTLGYSHNVTFELPAEVKATAVTERGKNPTIQLKSHDKQLIGQVAAKIRSLRKPEPFKGKGIKFVGEILRKKAGKSAAKGA